MYICTYIYIHTYIRDLCHSTFIRMQQRSGVLHAKFKPGTLFVPRRVYHRLPDGVGTNWVFTEGPQIPYICCVKCTHVATVCPHFHFPMNCDTFATTSFVLTPRGSWQVFARSLARSIFCARRAFRSAREARPNLEAGPQEDLLERFS